MKPQHSCAFAGIYCLEDAPNGDLRVFMNRATGFQETPEN
jgi:hypothetical protein